MLSLWLQGHAEQGRRGEGGVTLHALRKRDVLSSFEVPGCFCKGRGLPARQESKVLQLNGSGSARGFGTTFLLQALDDLRKSHLTFVSLSFPTCLMGMAELLVEIHRANGCLCFSNRELWPWAYVVIRWEVYIFLKRQFDPKILEKRTVLNKDILETHVSF